jgi:hypothetical protein
MGEKSLEKFTEIGGISASIEWFGDIPDSLEAVLELFGEGGKYEGMLDEETVSTIRSQISVTATEENPFGDNITFEAYPDDGYFVDVTCFREGE